MSRPLRVEYPGVVYHVTGRGNERKSIFRSNEDRVHFLKILGQVVERFHWRCHGYVLMGNQYHLLVETPDANLSRGMRHLNGVYTQGFNRRHRRVGHLFQGRFKAVAVDRDEYLLEVSRYIVLNPVRAGLVNAPEEWEWSSFRAIAGMIRPPDFLSVDWILSQFAGDEQHARLEYAQFVSRGIKSAYPLEALAGGILLGSQRYVRSMAGDFKRKSREKEIHRRQRVAAREGLEEIFQKGTRDGRPRDELIYQAYLAGDFPMREIGEFLGLHYSGAFGDGA